MGTAVEHNININVGWGSITWSTRLTTTPSIPRYAEYIQRLRSEVLGHKYVSGYIGSMGTAFRRRLLKGGMFLFPPTEANPQGKLRLLSEANPVAFLTEQAGGMAIEGQRGAFDIQPDNIHQHTSLVAGSRVKSADFERFA